MLTVPPWHRFDRYSLLRKSVGTGGDADRVAKPCSMHLTGRSHSTTGPSQLERCLGNWSKNGQLVILAVLITS